MPTGSIESLQIDFVTMGINGFMALVLAMLGHYVKSNVFPMMRVVTLLFALVATGMILGIAWR